MRQWGQSLVLAGLAGASLTLFLGFKWAPSVSIAAFQAPEAQRIFYWHVPSAWAAMISFGLLFVGSTVWFFKRSDWAWRMHVASTEAGLATGLIAVFSGCVWGAAEWGVPWDWTDEIELICRSNPAISILGFGRKSNLMALKPRHICRFWNVWLRFSSFLMSQQGFGKSDTPPSRYFRVHSIQTWDTFC